LRLPPEELSHAQAAAQLADHELDLAFAAALRQLETHPPVLSPEAQKIAARLQKSQKLLESDQAQVAQLTAALAQAADSQKSALQDQLDLAKSQLSSIRTNSRKQSGPAAGRRQRASAHPEDDAGSPPPRSSATLLLRRREPIRSPPCMASRSGSGSGSL